MQESSLLPVCKGAAYIIVLLLPGVPARRRPCYGALQIRYVFISLLDAFCTAGRSQGRGCHLSATPPRRSPDRSLPSAPLSGSLISFLCPPRRSSDHSPDRSSDRSSDLFQYLTCSALSCVKSHHLRVFILFTFQAILSWTQDFIAPSNLHHNLDRIARRPLVGSRATPLITSTRRRLSRRLACRIASWMARRIDRRSAWRSTHYFRSSAAFPTARLQDCPGGCYVAPLASSQSSRKRIPTLTKWQEWFMASKQLGVRELPPQRLHSIVRSTSAVEPARNVGEHIPFFV